MSFACLQAGAAPRPIGEPDRSGYRPRAGTGRGRLAFASPEIARSRGGSWIIAA